MSNLKKFEETLGSLDLEVNRLNAVSQAYEKLENLVASYDTIISKLKENNTTFIKIKDEQNKHLNSIEQNFKKIDKTIYHAGQDLNSTIEERANSILKENKEFYRDLESTIKIKLEDHKSQVKQLIEHERQQIKIIIIEVVKQSEDNLNRTLISQFEAQSKNIKNLKWSSWVLTSISLTILIIILFDFYIKK